MIKFDIDLKDLEKGKIVTKDKARRVLMKSMFKMEELAIRKVPVDRGGLRQSISVFPQILADNYVLTVAQPYAAVMEYGSRPFYAPIKPLKEWARRVLGDENAGYAVRAKIAKLGITAQPFVRVALHDVENVWLPQYLKEELSN